MSTVQWSHECRRNEIVPTIFQAKFWPTHTAVIGRASYRIGWHHHADSGCAKVERQRSPPQRRPTLHRRRIDFQRTALHTFLTIQYSHIDVIISNKWIPSRACFETHSIVKETFNERAVIIVCSYSLHIIQRQRSISFTNINTLSQSTVKKLI